MKPINELSLYEVVEAIRGGQISALEVAIACIERIEQREPDVQAFESFDADKALTAAKALEAVGPDSVLCGAPIGIKDIIDTVEYPSRCGSPIYSNRTPHADASCVALCRAAGANIFGKMVTTEFAYFSPGKTRNPHNLSHTPGGSSMGSAAAVADYMLPFAFGTQTAASVTRPSAYCGVIGYKASYGNFDLQGVCGLAPSLDTLGFITRDLRDIPLMRSVLCGDTASLVRIDDSSKIRIGFVRTPHWAMAEESTQHLLEDTARNLSQSGAQLSELQLPPAFSDLANLHNSIMSFEVARARSYEFTQHRELLSEQFSALVENGFGLSYQEYLKAKTRIAEVSQLLKQLFDQYDVFLVPSAPGEAPYGLRTTGDPIFNRMWTVLGVPSITLPAGNGDHGLPLGVQIVGAFNNDNQLVSIANWIRKQL